MPVVRHPNRLGRSKAKRMLKVAGRAQHASRRCGVEGLSCRICTPKPYARMDKRTAQDRAALEAASA